LRLKIYDKRKSILLSQRYDSKYVLRPNPEGFVFMSWKEREGGGMEGRKQ